MFVVVKEGNRLDSENTASPIIHFWSLLKNKSKIRNNDCANKKVSSAGFSKLLFKTVFNFKYILVIFFPSPKPFQIPLPYSIDF